MVSASRKKVENIMDIKINTVVRWATAGDNYITKDNHRKQLQQGRSRPITNTQAVFLASLGEAFSLAVCLEIILSTFYR